MHLARRPCRKVISSMRDGTSCTGEEHARWTWLITVRSNRAPGHSRGLSLMRQRPAYRLTWRVVPPPGAPVPGSPLENSLTQSASLSYMYELALALRSASRLSCGAPEAAVVNPGSSKITHEPRS